MKNKKRLFSESGVQNLSYNLKDAEVTPDLE